MSEELLQIVPQKVGKYTYYRLGSTTLEQLKNSGIISKKDYGELKTKKPDGIATYHNHVIAVVEWKTPEELSSKKDIDKAIKQEIEVAKALCKILVVTDGTKTFWVNALNGEFIKDSNGNNIKTVFHHQTVKHIWEIEYLLDEIPPSITATSSTIRNAKIVDPSPLATRLWQTIWVATGKSTVKCLYNVVELFIFKFLSDLKILADDYAFNHVYTLAQNNPEEAIEYYARNTRKKINALFPKGQDGTTIINGTIFVSETGEPNLSQSILFKRCLEHLQRYSEEFGSLTKIDKQFKTKLYESFLKEEVEALGQYFTPRRIIQSIIRMAGLDEPSFQYNGKRFCDPFCGVGGFPLELLNMNENMKECYRPDAEKKIRLPFVIHGFDKGFERDDERTIILAKANMLIYLAELLFANPQCTTEFATVFNDTFTLFKDNLGTFGYLVKNEDEKYHYILSNPPYVTSGSSIIKEEIRKTPRTINEYTVSSLGLEGLSIQWIIKSLKQGGKAFILIPDGILYRGVAGRKLRNHILSECYLDAIISLPIRTFFANSKHTYILVITKKNNALDVQTNPVFTCLISNIGERLTSIKREEIEADDLPEMEMAFKIFSATKAASRQLLEKVSTRCKVIDVQRFRDSLLWDVDHWWSHDERIELGLEEAKGTTGKEELDAMLSELRNALQDYENTRAEISLKDVNVKEVSLDDKSMFTLGIGKRVLKKNTVKAYEEGIPAYSANVFKPLGFIKEGNLKDFSHPFVLWGIDGNFGLRVMNVGEKFATTDHCGAIQILNPLIIPEYLLYALNLKREEESFDRTFRASLTNMSKLFVKIPIKPNGEFDVEIQQEIADRYMLVLQKKEKLEITKKQFDVLLKGYM
jgi:type I restriction enzyme M protein